MLFPHSCSVTSGRRSSRWTAAQFGYGRRSLAATVPAPEACSVIGKFTTNFAQTRFNNANLNTVKGISAALSGSPSVSQTISLARAAIQLAQSVIASYQK
jgi:hypothetical protein